MALIWTVLTLDVLQMNTADTLALQIVETVTLKAAAAAVIASDGDDSYESTNFHTASKKSPPTLMAVFKHRRQTCGVYTSVKCSRATVIICFGRQSCLLQSQLCLIV